MKNYNNIIISGIGITSSIGQGKKAFTQALMEGRHRFDIMKRPGRQNGTSFIGAEIDEITYPDSISKKVLRTASFSAKTAMVTLDEAWKEAKLDDCDSSRIGLVVGGSNIQQREQLLIHEKYKDRFGFISPTYGLSFMDSDICGLCTEHFGIKGMSYTLGGASASGQAAIIQGLQSILSGQIDVCIVIGALMDISYWECQAFRSLGAMGSDAYADEPEKACRPFDENHDGFIYGEACGAVVIERADTASKRKVEPYAQLLGWSTVLDGNRNPNPSYEGELSTIKKAMEKANLEPHEVDYVNPHGSGSKIGDETELKAICDSGLSHAYINATKSITGHGLSSAGTIEIIATMLQMKEGRLHPTINLDNPINTSLNWVKLKPVSYEAKTAINISIGFGGINTAICLRKI